MVGQAIQLFRLKLNEKFTSCSTKIVLLCFRFIFEMKLKIVGSFRNAETTIIAHVFVTALVFIGQKLEFSLSGGAQCTILPGPPLNKDFPYISLNF